MDWLQILSLVLNAIFGGGLFMSIVTLHATKREAAASAKKAEVEAEKAITQVKRNEIENVEAAIKIWRDMAQSMAERHSALMVEVDNLRKEVVRLRAVNNKIVRLLDRITPENLMDTVEKIKKEIEQDETNYLSAHRNAVADSLRHNEKADT